jgi:type IX secretion system PorP/SprF family membrane protein
MILPKKNSPHIFTALQNIRSTAIPMLKNIAFVLVSLLSVCNMQAQDLQMSQFYSAPLYLNPALAGVAYGPRVTLNYRNQWASLGDGFNGGYTSYMVGADMHIDKIRSGLGILFVGDQIMNNVYASYTVKLQFAPQFKIRRNLAIKIGIEGSYIHKKLNWTELQFSDQINPYYGFVDNAGLANPTGEQTPLNLSSNRGDFGAGFLIFSPKYYFGFAVSNFIMAKETFTNTVEARTPMRIVGHFGATLPFKNRRGKYNVYISPNILVANQGKNLQINGGLLVGVYGLYFGPQFRYVLNNPESFIGVVGFKKGKFRVGYSYDFTVSKLAGKTGGTHEISFTFNWAGDDNSLINKNNRGYLECPGILNF